MINELRTVLPLRLQISTLFLFFMWLFFQAYQPWQPIDHDLLYDTGRFNDVTDLSDWNREHGKVFWSDDTGYVSLKASSRLRFELAAFAGDLLLCSGRMKTENLQVGRKDWDAARIMVYFENDSGRIDWSHPHNVGYLSGNSDWQTFTTVIDVPSFARKGWIELAHYGKNGEAVFDDIVVRPAVWKPTYTHWQMFFGMLWASIMMWLIINSHLWGMPWGKALLITGLIIIVGVTLPPATMFQVASSGARLSQQVLDRAEEVLPVEQKKKLEAPASTAVAKPAAVKQLQSKVEKTSQTSQPAANAKYVDRSLSSHDVQKIGHMILFACLGYIAFIGFFNQVQPKILVYSLLLFAVSTEVLQLVVDGRLFGATDLLLDTVGIASGVFLAWMILRVRLRA